MINTIKSFLFLLLMFVIPCSAVGGGEDLHDSFKQYSNLVVDEEYEEIVENSISSENRSEFRQNPGSFKEQFPVLAALPETLSKRISHHESINSENKGCLTINGLDEGGEPTSLHIEYIKEQGRWRLNYAEIAYLESEKEFGSTGKCPVKPE